MYWATGIGPAMESAREKLEAILRETCKMPSLTCVS